MEWQQFFFQPQESWGLKSLVVNGDPNQPCKKPESNTPPKNRRVQSLILRGKKIRWFIRSFPPYPATEKQVDLWRSRSSTVPRTIWTCVSWRRIFAEISGDRLSVWAENFLRLEILRVSGLRIIGASKKEEFDSVFCRVWDLQTSSFEIPWFLGCVSCLFWSMSIFCSHLNPSLPPPKKLKQKRHPSVTNISQWE